MRFIDFFSGIGGFRLGMEKAGHVCVGHCEIDKYANKSYIAMHNPKESEWYANDITRVKPEDVPEAECYCGGFPCQAFSLAGSHGGFDDDFKGQNRGNLFLDVVRICKYHKPKVIFCENVKGLVIHDKGRTFRVIREAFRGIGYQVFWKVLNSKNFGVPQNRERIYIVAFRDDLNIGEFIFPTGTNEKTCIRDIMEDAPIPPKYYLSDVYVNTLRAHKARHEAKGHGFGYEIRDLDDIAGAIVCGGMGRERNLLIDHREHSTTPTTHIKGVINAEDIRKMTPREWARLQGFPDEYFERAASVCSDSQLYKQAGNSVTVNVIYEIAKRLVE